MFSRAKVLTILGGTLGVAAVAGIATYLIRRFGAEDVTTLDDDHAEQALALGDLDGDPRTTRVAQEYLGIRDEAPFGFQIDDVG